MRTMLHAVNIPSDSCGTVEPFTDEAQTALFKAPVRTAL